MKWIKFSEENLPEPKKLVWVKRIKGDVYLSFKEQLINDFIPRIEEMAKKEKEHLFWLIDKHAPIDFIQLSQKYYNHFTQRIKEYQEYAERL
jgi:hypothetical protein